MGSNGSFFQNGLPLSTLETGLGNVNPGAPVANKADSSFYLSGSVYATLMNSDALLAAITAQQVIATNEAGVSTAQANASAASAVNSAASAAAAAATLASSLKIANNLSDLGSLSTALVNLGLNNVNNTSDANKPVSTAQASALALKANIASPTLTGVPAAPTASALTNSTQIATTAYADGAVSVLSGTTTAALALKAPLASPSLTGTPTAPTAAVDTNTTQLATTAMVIGQAASATPLIDGSAAVGTSTRFARADHVHPTDTTRAPLASPAFTGTPTGPTASVGNNTTQLATTAFVIANSASSVVTSIGTQTGPLTIAGGNVTSSVLPVSRYDVAQSLTATQQAQARTNVYASPFDAMANNNIAINAACEISQELGNTSFALTSGTAAYVQDCWKAKFNSAATLQLQAYPMHTFGVGWPPAGLTACTLLSTSTGLATLATGDYGYINNVIEGYRASRLNFGAAGALSVALGFWVYTTIAGTFSVTLQNSAGTRSYITNVVTAGGGWQYFTITVPGDAAGTWLNTNGVGLNVIFCFGSGASQQDTPGQWNANGNFATSSTTNFFATSGNSVAVTGLFVAPGTEAPTSSRLAHIMRPYDQELLLCRRYYQTMNFVASSCMADVFSNTASANIPLPITFSPVMRAAPTGSISNLPVGTNLVSNTPSYFNTTPSEAVLNWKVSSASVRSVVTANASGTVAIFDARL